MKTDNSFFSTKVKLRLENLPDKDPIRVLDAFAGEGHIWNEVEKQSGREILYLGIDKQKKGGIANLHGDNLKILPTLNLTKFDVIDLDAYGIPYKQLRIVIEKQFQGIVFVTAIQSGMGQLPKKMLFALGYTKEMLFKVPTMFNREGFGKIKNYLYLHGIERVRGYFIDRKNYFCFTLNQN